LQEGNVFATGAMGEVFDGAPFGGMRLVRRGGGGEAVGVEDVAEGWDAGLEEARESGGLMPGDEELGLGVAEDIGLTRGVFGDAVGAERRVDGDGDSAGEEDSGEGEEKFGARGEHDGDGLFGLEATAGEFGGDGGGAVVELAERDGAQIAVFLVEVNVGAGGLASTAQAENFGESFGAADLLFEAGAKVWRSEGRGGRGGCGRGGGRGGNGAGFFAQDGADQVLDGIRFGDDAIGKANAAGFAEAQHEFDALEAAQAEFALEVRGGMASGQFFEAARAIELNEELADGGDGLRFDEGLAIEFCSGGGQ